MISKDKREISTILQELLGLIDEKHTLLLKVLLMVNLFFICLGILMSLTTTQSASVLKEELFAKPSLISAKVSPDGNTIASVGADANGISNVFLDLKEQITSFDTPEIIQFFWSGDGRKVLLLKDENGTGQLHLHGIDILEEHVVSRQRDFLPSMPKSSKSAPKNSAVIGLNHRTPHFHDLYRLDLDSGQCELLFQNDSYAKFLVSDNLELILKMRIDDADGSWTVFTPDNAVFMQLSSSDAFHTEFLSYDEKKHAVYLLDNRSSDTNQLILKPLSLSSDEKILGAPLESDVDEVLFIAGEPKAYASYYEQKKWYAIDTAIDSDLAFLEKYAGPNFEVVNSSRSGEAWIVSNSIPDRGGQFWLYDRNTQDLFPLSPLRQKRTALHTCIPLPSTPEMDRRSSVTTLCLETQGQRRLRRQTDSPRRRTSWRPFQSQGQISIRSLSPMASQLRLCSTQRQFSPLFWLWKSVCQCRQWRMGRKAHLDVIDAVEACIEKGLTEKDKLAVFGGSYGGFEALAGLTFSPDYFTCCIALCAPSHLKTILDKVPKFWEFTSKPLSDKLMFFTKRAFITSMGGNPDTPEGIDYLEKCSPINHLEAIKAPLLLVHGKNDHIVTEKASQQIYNSMKANHSQVTYILFPDEGHRFANFSNKMLYLDHAERFLSQHLGGRYQPVNPNITASSSAQISD